MPPVTGDRIVRAAILLSAALMLGLGVQAASGQERPGRFTMAPIDVGFARLDTETGAMSMCTAQNGRWSCEPMSDRTAAFQDKIERLELENAALKAEIERLEKSLASGEPRKHAERPQRRFELPSEEDVDRAFDYMERLFRRFRDRLQQFQGEERKGTPL
jgi:uncharacterized small protein (DUF1192 family)